jgi:uridine kinase
LIPLPRLAADVIDSGIQPLRLPGHFVTLPVFRGPSQHGESEVVLLVEHDFLVGRISLDEIITAISARPVGGIRIVGIDGPAASGKSTLTRRLMDLTAASLVEIDDFVSWTNVAGWWPRFDDQVLQPLLRGEDAHYQVRDFENDPYGTSLGGWKTVAWSPLVIFDGVTCSRRAVADILAYRIWVEAPEEVRLKRGLVRDGEEALDLWLGWMQQERAFFFKDATRERADLLVDGTASIDVVDDQVWALTIDKA